MENYTKITGFADEIAQELDIQTESLKKLDIHYVEMRGADGNNLIFHTDEKIKVFDECIKTATEKIEKIKKTKEVLGFSTNYVAPDFVIHKNNRINRSASS